MENIVYNEAVMSRPVMPPGDIGAGVLRLGVYGSLPGEGPFGEHVGAMCLCPTPAIALACIVAAVAWRRMG